MVPTTAIVKINNISFNFSSLIPNNLSKFYKSFKKRFKNKPLHNPHGNSQFTELNFNLKEKKNLYKKLETQNNY